MSDRTEDIALRAHHAAVQHLLNLTKAMWAEEDGADIDWAELGTVGPYDGCDDCVVREVATVVIAELEASGAIRVLNPDTERPTEDDAEGEAMTPIDHARDIIERHLPAMPDQVAAFVTRDAALALDAAGLLATPAATGDARMSWMGRDFPVTLLEEEQP